MLFNIMFVSNKMIKIVFKKSYEMEHPVFINGKYGYLKKIYDIISVD